MSRVVTLGEPMVMFIADEPGPLELANHYTRYIAGAELNVSIGLRRLGHEVIYITRLGEDPLGRYIHNFLGDAGVDTSAITFDMHHSTGFQLKSRALHEDPEVVYFRKNSAASHLTADALERIDFTKVNHVHITGIPLAISDESREVTFALIERAKAANIFLTFDPNLRPSLWSSHVNMVSTVNKAASLCDIVLPGIEEGHLLTGLSGEKEIAHFYHGLGVKGVVVKLGPMGAYIDYNNEQGYVPGFPINDIVDTVGAGDGFAVGVISGLVNGLCIQDAVLEANAIGAMQVMVRGDNEGLPTRATLNTFLQEHAAH